MEPNSPSTKFPKIKPLLATRIESDSGLLDNHSEPKNAIGPKPPSKWHPFLHKIFTQQIRFLCSLILGHDSKTIQYNQLPSNLTNQTRPTNICPMWGLHCPNLIPNYFRPKLISSHQQSRRINSDLQPTTNQSGLFIRMPLDPTNPNSRHPYQSISI